MILPTHSLSSDCGLCPADLASAFGPKTLPMHLTRKGQLNFNRVPHPSQMESSWLLKFNNLAGYCHIGRWLRAQQLPKKRFFWPVIFFARLHALRAGQVANDRSASNFGSKKEKSASFSTLTCNKRKVCWTRPLTFETRLAQLDVVACALESNL